MAHFFLDIAHAPGGKVAADAVRQLVQGNAALAAAARPWDAVALPSQTDHYVLVVISSDDLAEHQGAHRRVVHASEGDFPIVFVVPDVSAYDFSEAPLDVLQDVNAEGLSDPERVIRTLLHHGGLSLFEGGGKVFISYARSDGTEIAEALRRALQGAGLFGTMDVHDFPGGERIQREIVKRLQDASMAILVDTDAANISPWVAEEIDIAVAARVPTLAVSPRGGLEYQVRIPHESWDAADADASAERVVAAVRRELGRRVAFSGRVHRTLGRIARLRRWDAVRDVERWRLTTQAAGAEAELLIGCTPDRPTMDDVTTLHDHVRNRGLLVGGTRPLPHKVKTAYDKATDGKVCVTSLGTMASKIPERMSARPLRAHRVFLSAAMPSDPEERALADRTLYPFVVSLTQALIPLGVTLVFGGHPSVTPLVHKAVVDQVGDEAGGIELHQARLWQDSTALRAEVREGPLFHKARWHGDAKGSIAENIRALRDGMIEGSLTAAVFVGGKTHDFKGPRPGIVDEYERFVKACPERPAFRLGLAGGAARTLPRGDGLLERFLMGTTDPDLAVGLIVAELLGL